jgi:hypothetical protein
MPITLLLLKRIIAAHLSKSVVQCHAWIRRQAVSDPNLAALKTTARVQFSKLLAIRHFAPFAIDQNGECKVVSAPGMPTFATRSEDESTSKNIFSGFGLGVARNGKRICRSLQRAAGGAGLALRSPQRKVR